MLAIDHRGSFKKIINPQDPDSVTDEEVIGNKTAIIQALGDQLTGILVDVDWGLPALKKFGFTAVKPYLLAIEKTGYQEKNGERITELEYHVDQLKQMGAKGVKLLVYFNPFSPTATQQLISTPYDGTSSGSQTDGSARPGNMERLCGGARKFG